MKFLRNAGECAKRDYRPIISLKLQFSKVLEKPSTMTL